jgi:hypothetical protein
MMSAKPSTTSTSRIAAPTVDQNTGGPNLHIIESIPITRISIGFSVPSGSEKIAIIDKSDQIKKIVKEITASKETVRQQREKQKNSILFERSDRTFMNLTYAKDDLKKQVCIERWYSENLYEIMSKLISD